MELAFYNVFLKPLREEMCNYIIIQNVIVSVKIKNYKIRLSWCYLPIIPATQDDQSSRPSWARSYLGKNVSKAL
jgi:hypothetical protein